jgi:2-polyprenyl-3-methyl-5-hydroxy-6-metoxy-1,4-benzoquinol methylase
LESSTKYISYTHFDELIECDSVTEEVHRPKKKRRMRGTFPFGNYTYYYNYRIQNEIDPRINVMKAEWFESKNCLDIGCNDGSFTLDLVSIFNVKHIEGVDIDPKLIQHAKRNLAKRLTASSNVSFDDETHDTSLLQAGVCLFL